jgi:hypothetical protein
LRPKTKLSASMTVTQFDHGYWYATELKRFAKRLGIQSAGKLRKDELERAIPGFLRTGVIAQPIRRSLSAPAERDVERGLHLGLRVVGYINDAETKQFLEREARKLVPGLRWRSGARYRLNPLARGADPQWSEDHTYGDLVREYVRFNQSTERFARVPHGRYINFMSDFLAARAGATKEQAIKAWSALESMEVPKTYSAWVRARSAKSR